MSYLGQVELKSSEIRRVDVTGSTSATHTLTWTPASEQSLIITINGIKQQNNYSISGTTLTLDDALISTDAMEVIGILDIGEAVTPPDDSISTAKIQDDAVTADKLANSINTEIAANTAKVTNATHTGDVTGATALTIAADAVDIAMLSATGTASASTFLRGDNSWAAAGGDNTPAFQAYLSSNQSIPNDAYTLIECDTEDFDTGSGYDTSTFTYTVPSGEGGVYWIYFHCDYAASAHSYAEYGALQIRVNAETNSTASFSNWWNLRSNPGRQMNPWTAGMRTLAAADTIKFYAYGAMLSSNWTVQGSARRDTLFGAYKMLGIT
jgi:hypothetical protein